MSLPMLADKLDGEMKRFVTFVKEQMGNNWWRKMVGEIK